MKRLQYLLITCAIIWAHMPSALGQNQSTSVGAIHTYKINSSQDVAYHAASTYEWSVTNGIIDVDYVVVDASIGNEWEIQWLTASPVEHYTVQVSETRAGCYTLRQFNVEVTNGFDAAVAFATGQADDICPGAESTIISDQGTPGFLEDDDFGTTNVKVKVALSNTAWTPKWIFDYTVTSTSAEITNVQLDDATGTENFTFTDATDSGHIDVLAGTTQVVLVITVKTMPDAIQEIDLTISGVTEKTTGNDYTDTTPANDLLGAGNTITILAMPATTGITVN